MASEGEQAGLMMRIEAVVPCGYLHIFREKAKARGVLLRSGWRCRLGRLRRPRGEAKSRLSARKKRYGINGIRHLLVQ